MECKAPLCIFILEFRVENLDLNFYLNREV